MASAYLRMKKSVLCKSGILVLFGHPFLSKLRGSEEQAPSGYPPAPIVTKDVMEEKPASDQPAVVAEEKHATDDESKALAIVETEKKEAAVEPVLSKNSEGGSLDRDTVLAKVNSEKRLALIKAWEENEKAKAENKCYKSLSTITAWENTKKSSAETRMKRAEEKLEKKKSSVC